MVTLPATLKGPAKHSPVAPKAAPTASRTVARSVTPRLEDLDAKKGSCFACGVKTAKEAEGLLKCGSCKFALYCSRECQRSDWKKGHRLICGHLGE
jgi:hypothetical protein